MAFRIIEKNTEYGNKFVAQIGFLIFWFDLNIGGYINYFVTNFREEFIIENVSLEHAQKTIERYLTRKNSKVKIHKVVIKK